MSVAFLFPGQGAQQVGMMADLAEASSSAREVFARADAQLGFALSEVCFNGPPERLDATDVSQPAMFVCSVAAIAAMREALGSGAPSPAILAGLSLGEYTAYHAAGAIDFADALGLVAKRGRFMQEASQAAPSGMVSIIGLAEERVVELCRSASDGQVLSPANFNCPGQIVISGELAACERAAAMAEQFGASRAIPLKVAGAFHSRLMAPAAEKLAEAIADVEFCSPTVPVVSNVDARCHSEPADIKRTLVEQVTSPVRWALSMEYVIGQGADEFYEIGPGRVLAGLMRRIDRKLEVTGIQSASSLARLAGQRAG